MPTKLCRRCYLREGPLLSVIPKGMPLLPVVSTLMMHGKGRCGRVHGWFSQERRTSETANVEWNTPDRVLLLCCPSPVPWLFLKDARWSTNPSNEKKERSCPVKSINLLLERSALVHNADNMKTESIFSQCERNRADTKERWVPVRKKQTRTPHQKTTHSEVNHQVLDRRSNQCRPSPLTRSNNDGY